MRIEIRYEIASHPAHVYTLEKRGEVNSQHCIKVSHV